ncbi:MAG: response regulator [Eubacteriales bacterium]|nr:response regulator [Eubacteriales bacterium]MDY4008946.1 response regulator [Candidatus Limiplasma sp.]
MFSVLIVDDETLVRDTLTRFIRWQDIGFDSVRCAENGLRALEAIRQEPPSVIISDIKMPHMNGIDFANRAREICPQSKLVFLSGYSDKEYLKGAISLKVDGYIEKPIDIGQIVALMTQLREECWKEYISSNPAIAFFRGPAQALTPLNDQVFHLSKERLGAFYTLIKAKEQSEAMAFFDALMDELQACEATPPEYARAVFMRLMAELEEASMLNGLKSICAQYEAFAARIPIIESLPALRQEMRRLVAAYFEALQRQSFDPVRLVNDYLQGHYTEEALSVDAIARRLNFTTSYLCSIYKRKTGCTILKALTMLRMDKAKQLLSDTSLKLYEVGGKVGYADGKYFTRVFTKEVGMSPREYRERHYEGV